MLLRPRRTAAAPVLLCLLLSFAATPACDRVARSRPPADPRDYLPDRDLAELFHDVQLAAIFPDSKTFADAEPLRPPADILATYRLERRRPGFQLRGFVLANFRLPEASPTAAAAAAADTAARAFEARLHHLWSVLARPADDTARRTWSTRIPLPYPYVVPGGRFREIYYWDSYFTALGLVRSRRIALFEGMLDNFAYLVRRYGRIPNGSRTYYRSRSQPPVFGIMLRRYEDVLADSLGRPRARQIVRQRYLPALRAEYAFWMHGADSLRALPPAAQPQAYRRVVRLPDGSILNRYWDDAATPRPESYREDYRLARGLPPAAQRQLWRNLRAAAESGWDFSARWMDPPYDLRRIRTTDILPLDLNVLLACTEAYLASFDARPGATAVRSLARFRRPDGICTDWDLRDARHRPATAAAFWAAFHPLPATADTTAATAARQPPLAWPPLLRAGGVLTTAFATGQQWDAPNGWPPLQYLAYHAYRATGDTAIADTLRSRWLRLNRSVYARTGRMMEKYNVLDTTRPAGGGEYPTQDGFGWTNGVALDFLHTPAPQ